VQKALTESIEAAPGDVKALERAFAHFTRQTEQLKGAYRELKDEARDVNLRLEAANVELARKVRELDEAYNFQRSILGSMPTAVVVTDLDGTVNTLNPAAEAMWGAPRPQAAGRHFRELMGADGDLLAAVLEGRSRRHTLRRELGGEQPRIISSTACLVEDSEGRPIGAVQLDEDVTRLCELEERLHQEEKLADLGRMAAALAHEIRKPLNGIKGFASILERRASDDPTDRRYVSNIVRAADRLNGMLGRLLGFARPDRLRAAPCDLRAVADQTAAFVRAEQDNVRATIEVDVPEEARAVLADADKLTQVLLNLVKNGVEALDGPGQVRLSARPRQRDGAPCVRVAVCDTGRGIAPEQRARILEPFYSDRPGGTGLGLAIVSRLLQLHGAQLEVSSRPGQGTEMAFVLPAACHGDDT